MGLKARRGELEIAYYNARQQVDELALKAQAMKQKIGLLEARCIRLEKRISALEDKPEKENKESISQADIIDEWLNGEEGAHDRPAQ